MRWAATTRAALPAFVAAMNRKAHALGMTDTHYVEPTGLSSRNQSSARDLATLVKAAHQVPLIRELSTSPEYQVEVGNRQVQFRNTNGLVRSPAWDIGLQKTGYINEAGRCLVMQAKMAGRKLIMVFLDSAGKYSRIGDAERVRRWITTPVARACRRRSARTSCRSDAPQPGAFRPRSRLTPRLSRDGRARRDLRGRGAQAFEPGFLQPIRRRRDRQAGDQLALVVEDARRHAAHARARVPRRRAPCRTGSTRASSRSSRGSSVMLLRVWPARPVRVA